MLVLLSLASSSSLIAHHIAWLKLCACLISSMHEVSVTLRLWALHSTNFRFSLFIFNSRQLLLSLYFHEVSRNTAYSANKEMRSTDESYLLTKYPSTTKPPRTRGSLRRRLQKSTETVEKLRKQLQAEQDILGKLVPALSQAKENYETHSGWFSCYAHCCAWCWRQ